MSGVRTFVKVFCYQPVVGFIATPLDDYCSANYFVKDGDNTNLKLT
jgi:hypothetical protein